MGNRHELLESTSVFQGRFLEMLVDRIRLPDGEESVREWVRHPGAAAVVAMEGGRVLLVRQNRHAVGENLLEVPAGKLDPAGEDPEVCARRELEEETGYSCGKMEPLVSFFASPGFTNEVIHVFLATGISRAGPPPETDHGEPITIEWVGLEEVIGGIVAGIIRDSKTIIGLLLARLKLGPPRS